MSECEFHLRVQAYHDGELRHDEAARREVEAHLPHCPACVAELQALRELSMMMAPAAIATENEPTAEEVRRMHQAVAGAARQQSPTSLLRLGGMLSALAASILIISAAWLAEGPSVNRPAGRTVVVGPRVSNDEADWQRTAMAAQADPRPRVFQQSDSPYAEHLADKQLSGWMMFNLDPKEP